MRILVSSPLCFTPPPTEQAANAFEIQGRRLYERDPDAFRQHCLEEHNAKMQFLSSSCLASVIHIPHTPDAPDSVFTRDGSVNLVVKNNGTSIPISIISKFTNSTRNIEAAMHRNVLETLDAERRLIYQSPFALEGGDIQLDPVRKIFWGGYHPNPGPHTAREGRTSLEAHDFITEKTGIPFVSLQTGYPRYHLDTFLGVAPKGELVVCFEGMAKADRDAIMENGFEKPGLDPKDLLIEVSAQEADRFATNFLGVNGNIIMPAGNPRLAAIFREHGYAVDEFSMRYISAGGGSSHCSTNEIDREIVLDDQPALVNGMA